jgi:cysteine desulfurase
MTPLYLDYNATAPLRPEALQAMLPWLGESFGNPSSTHRAGQQARAAIEGARERLALLLDCKASQIIFTSGGTESINLALRGSATAHFRLQTSKAEHHAVLRCAESLSGAQLDFLEVDAEGMLRIRQPKGGMVSLMHANNETGAVHPIAELAELAHRHGALLHCDAVQSFGKLPFSLPSLGADLLSVSAHKFGGPKGAGFLVVGEHAKLMPQILGGEQEGGLRGGTQNVAGILGMAKAAELALAELEEESLRLGLLRDQLQIQLLQRMPGLKVNSASAPRVPNTLSVLLPGIESDLMIMRLDQEGVMVSAGSACAAGAVQSSHVLSAMGVPAEEAKCVIRFSLGKATRDVDIPRAVSAVEAAVGDFRKAGL